MGDIEEKLIRIIENQKGVIKLMDGMIQTPEQGRCPDMAGVQMKEETICQRHDASTDGVPQNPRRTELTRCA